MPLNLYSACISLGSLHVEGQGFRSGSTCSQSGWERIQCYSILVQVRRSFFRASPPDPPPLILPLSGSPGVDSTIRCISQARVQTWANIMQYALWCGQHASEFVFRAHPSSELTCGGPRVQSWAKPDLRFTSVEGREAACKLRFRASPPDTLPVILPCSGSLLYR